MITLGAEGFPSLADRPPRLAYFPSRDEALVNALKERPGSLGPEGAIGSRILTQILDAVDDCVLVADEDGRIEYANRAAARLLGVAPGGLVGESLSDVLSSDGGTVSKASHLFTDIDGRRIHRVSVLRDITTEARLREQLLQSEKMSAVGQLVAGVAHDLNNPLTSIVGYAQLLLARPGDARSRRGLEVIAGEAARASRIVRNLLVFARKHTPEKRYLGVNGIIQKTLELKAHDFRVNDIAVVTDLQEDLPRTMVDFHQVQQVIFNLLLNAEQAIRAERSRGTVRVATRTIGPGIRIVVEDDGAGIPEAIMTRIFDPFFTTKPVGTGTGLGLSICHGIVAEHGGTIRAENRPDGGARFTIELPVAAPERDAAEESRAGDAREAGADAGPGSGKSILVIDDEMPIQDVLVAMLTMEGHRVDTASSGDGALRKLRERHYDLILSDLRMPGVGGMEFYERLRTKDPAMAERIVFMTGDLVNEESSRFLDGTANILLPKPFTIEALRATLRHFDERFPSH